MKRTMRAPGDELPAMAFGRKIDRPTDRNWLSPKMNRPAYLLLAALPACSASETADDEKPRPMPVSVLEVRLEPEATLLRPATGLIRSRQASDLGFERGGKIRTVVAEGTEVEADQVLARMDTRALEIERRRVRAGLAEAVARRDLAVLTSKRSDELADARFAPRQAADEASFGRRAAESGVEGLEATLARIEHELQRSVLLAPFAGTVTRRLADAGAVVGAGAPVLRLLGRGKEVVIGLPPEHARTVSGPVSITVGRREVRATPVGWLDDVEPRTRTLGVVLALPADFHAIDGELARLAWPSPVAGPGVWLPLSALVEGSRGTWDVFTVGDDGRVARAAVLALATDGDRAFVQGTLRDGDRVVSTGLHRVVPGQKVSILEPGRADSRATAGAGGPR